MPRSGWGPPRPRGERESRSEPFYD
jgi:hypothetical protein